MFRGSLILAIVLLFCSPLAAQNVPTNIAALYESIVDNSVSDEFNGTALDTSKWGYRTESAEANWRSSNVTIEDNGADRYLNLLGTMNRGPDANNVIVGSGTSAGVYSRESSGYGFYTTRWRADGIIPNTKSSWHPAIWRANVLPTNGWQRGTFPGTNTPLPPQQIELDFVEFNQWVTPSSTVQWHSQAIDWARDASGNTVETRLQNKPFTNDFADTFWNTHGLEYHPDYIQLWEKEEDPNSANHGQWSKRGAQITVSDAPTSNSPGNLNINRETAHPGHWILSNYDFFNQTNRWYDQFGPGRPINLSDGFVLEDHSFQIDHFRFFPLLDNPGPVDPPGPISIIDGFVTSNGALDGDLLSISSGADTYDTLSFATVDNSAGQGSLLHLSGSTPPASAEEALSDHRIDTGQLSTGEDTVFWVDAKAEDKLFIIFDSTSNPSYFQGPGLITAVDQDGNQVGNPFDATESILIGDQFTTGNLDRTVGSTLTDRLLLGVLVEIDGFNVLNPSDIAGFTIAGEVTDANTSANSLDIHTVGVVSVPEPALPGDFNGDGRVDTADYTVWRDQLGAEDDGPIGNAGDGVAGVTRADYDVWAEHFGTGATLATPVPEPAALVMLVYGTAVVQAAGRRRARLSQA